MADFSSGGTGLIGYDAGECLLELLAGATEPYAPGPTDYYWKIGLTVRDLDHAVSFLRRIGWPVSDPRQFREIGYLAHMRDPDGLAIELLQQGFAGDARPPGQGHSIGGQASVAHITLRVDDIARARRYCERHLGLRLMSVQPVPPRDFTLYFFAWSDEVLPSPDLEAVQNRPWLWARPYTVLELQSLEGPGQRVARDIFADRPGFDGFSFGPRDGGTLTPVPIEELVRSL